MSITLGSITLPDGMIFENEFADNAATFSDQRTLSGDLIRQTGVKNGGREIKMVGGWASRTTVIALKAVQDAGTTSTLKMHDGTTYEVKIEAIAATQIIAYQQPVAADYYSLSLTLTEMAN